jgi:hypothetical protein
MTEGQHKELNIPEYKLSLALMNHTDLLNVYTREIEDRVKGNFDEERALKLEIIGEFIINLMGVK